MGEDMTAIVAAQIATLPHGDGYRATFFDLDGNPCGYVDMQEHIEVVHGIVCEDMGLGLFAPCQCETPQWQERDMYGMLECTCCGGDEHRTFFGE